MTSDQTVCLHFAQLLGKGTAVKIQIIGQLLTVERNLEGGASGSDCNRRQIGQ